MNHYQIDQIEPIMNENDEIKNEFFETSYYKPK